MNLRPGDITFAHIQKFVDEVVTVGEDDIAKAVGWLSRHARLVAEPSGAVTTAAVKLGLGHPTGQIVAIVKGGKEVRQLKKGEEGAIIVKLMPPPGEPRPSQSLKLVLPKTIAPASLSRVTAGAS